MSVVFIYLTNISSNYPFLTKQLTLQKVGMVLGTQLIFDWIKYMVMFKISNINVNYFRLLTYELQVFHDKLSLSCFNETGSTYSSNKSKVKYLKFLSEYEIKLYNRDKLENYLGRVESDHLLTIEMKNSILVQSVLVVV